MFYSNLHTFVRNLQILSSENIKNRLWQRRTASLPFFVHSITLGHADILKNSDAFVCIVARFRKMLISSSDVAYFSSFSVRIFDQPSSWCEKTLIGLITGVLAWNYTSKSDYIDQLMLEDENTVPWVRMSFCSMHAFSAMTWEMLSVGRPRNR